MSFWQFSLPAHVDRRVCFPAYGTPRKTNVGGEERFLGLARAAPLLEQARRTDVDCPTLRLARNGTESMRFYIEVIRADASGTTVLHRRALDEITPKRVKDKADATLRAWRHRGATGARILNHLQQNLYDLG